MALLIAALGVGLGLPPLVDVVVDLEAVEAGREPPLAPPRLKKAARLSCKDDMLSKVVNQSLRARSH